MLMIRSDFRMNENEEELRNAEKVGYIDDQDRKVGE